MKRPLNSIMLVSIFLLMGVINAHALQYLISPYYDVNKYSFSGNSYPSYLPNGVNDGILCWDAAISNILMYTGWGIDRDGDLSTELYDDIYDEFVMLTINWVSQSNTVPIYSIDTRNPLYYYMSEHYPDINWLDYIHQTLTLNTMLENIALWLSADYNYGVCMRITNDGSYNVGMSFFGWAHFVTVWGYETDDTTGKYTKIALTDSEKGVGIGETHLEWYSLDFRDNRWYLKDYNFYGNMNSAFICEVAGYEQKPNSEQQNPEPATLLLVSAGLACLFGFRLKYSSRN